MDLTNALIEPDKYLKVTPKQTSCRSLEYLPSKPNWLSRLIGWLSGKHPASNLDRVVSTATKIAKEAINNPLNEMQAIVLQRNLVHLKSKAEKHNNHWLVKFISHFSKRILCNNDALKNIQDQINQLENIKREFISKAKAQNTQPPTTPSREPVNPKPQESATPNEKIRPANSSSEPKEDIPIPEHMSAPETNTLKSADHIEVKKEAIITGFKPASETHFPWESANLQFEKYIPLEKNIPFFETVNPETSFPTLTPEQIDALHKLLNKEMPAVTATCDAAKKILPSSQTSGTCAMPNVLSLAEFKYFPITAQAAVAASSAAPTGDQSTSESFIPVAKPSDKLFAFFQSQNLVDKQGKLIQAFPEFKKGTPPGIKDKMLEALKIKLIKLEEQQKMLKEVELQKKMKNIQQLALISKLFHETFQSCKDTIQSYTHSQPLLSSHWFHHALKTISPELNSNATAVIVEENNKKQMVSSTITDFDYSYEDLYKETEPSAKPTYINPTYPSGGHFQKDDDVDLYGTEDAKPNTNDDKSVMPSDKSTKSVEEVD